MKLTPWSRNVRALAVICCLVVGAQDAVACTCRHLPVLEQLAYSHYVFAGTVVDVDTTMGYLVAEVEVDVVWKGRVTRKFEVWTSGSGMSCGFNDSDRKFLIGEKFVLYARKPSEYIPAAYTTLCDRNLKYDEAADDLRILGPGRSALWDDQIQNVHLDLGKPYPNPARKKLTVPFKLRQAGVVELSLFDTLGREVAILGSDRFLVGAHSIEAVLPDLAAGTYLVVLRMGGGGLARPLFVYR